MGKLSRLMVTKGIGRICDLEIASGPSSLCLIALVSSQSQKTNCEWYGRNSNIEALFSERFYFLLAIIIYFLNGDKLLY